MIRSQLCVAVFLVACSGTVGGVGRDDGSGAPDPVRADAGADAGAVADAGPEVDAGPAVDAGPVFDAGTRGADAGLPSVDGGFFGESRCASSGLAFCDDFDGPNIDAQRWSYYGKGPNTTEGYAEIASTRSARGGAALHLHTTPGKGASLGAQHLPFLPGEGFFLRAMMYFEQPIPDHHVDYFLATDSSTVSQFTLGSLDGKLGIVKYYLNRWDHAEVGDPLVTQRWICVEWQVEPSTQTVRVWLDEQEVAPLQVTQWEASAFKALGLQLSGYDGTYDLWIDAFAYDRARIGCRK